jgi:hypothetical protein
LQRIRSARRNLKWSKHPQFEGDASLEGISTSVKRLRKKPQRSVELTFESAVADSVAEARGDNEVLAEASEGEDDKKESEEVFVGKSNAEAPPIPTFRFSVTTTPAEERQKHRNSLIVRQQTVPANLLSVQHDSESDSDSDSDSSAQSEGGNEETSKSPKGKHLLGLGRCLGYWSVAAR